MKGIFRHRDFRLLFAGQAVSAVGDQIFPIAVAIKVLDAGGGESELGLVLAARIAAFVVFVVAGGVWADRIKRTTVMVGSDALRMIAVTGLALTPGHVPLWVLAGLTFLVGAGEAFFRPAYGAVLPTVLPEDELGAANAATSVSLRTAAIFGPAIGGAVVGLAGGVRNAFFIDAATFAVSLVSLAAIREPELVREREKRSAVREALDGLRAVRDRPWIAAVLVMACLQVMIAVAPTNVLLPVVARDRLGGDRSYGLILTAMAVGGLLGALVASRFRPRLPGLWSHAGLLLYALFPLGLVFPAVPIEGVLVASFLAGFGLEPFLVYWASALQREVPRDLLARVISLDWLVSLGLMPVGFALTGPAVNAFGRSAVLAVAVVVIVVTTLLTLLVPGVPEFSGRSLVSARREAALGGPPGDQPVPDGAADLAVPEAAPPASAPPRS